MKINIIVIGKLKEKFLIDAANEYLKRLKPYATIEIIEIPEGKTIDIEGEKIFSRLNFDSWICLLDVNGENISSEDFAKKISELTLSGQSNLTFIIGGAFGISQKLKNSAQFKLSLSKMTFTHQMARIILLEQIYRSFKINRNEPYHY